VGLLLTQYFNSRIVIECVRRGTSEKETSRSGT
jgi:hypothetical protein